MKTKEDILKYKEDVQMTYDVPPIFEILLFERARKGTRDDGSESYLPDTGAEERAGFYYSIDDAIGALRGNACNLHEMTYHYAMVICRFPGLYDCVGPNGRMFFQWDEEREGFFEAEEPEIFRHIAY